MSKQKSRTRVIHGCKECRLKHTKCDLDADRDSCKRCLQTGQACEFDSRIKFKAVTSITEKLNDKKRRYDFTYEPGQTWVKPTTPVKFYTSTVDGESTREDVHRRGLELAVPSVSQHPSNEALDPTPTIENRSDTLDINSSRPSEVERPHLPPFRTTFPAFPRPDSRHEQSVYTLQSPPTSTFSPGSHSHPQSPATNILRPSSGHRNTVEPYHPQDFRSMHDPSPSLVAFPESRVSSLYQLDSLWPKMTPKEAKLLKHYVDKLSQWIDATDSQRHFGTEVVRRTAHYPILLNAILAFASLHMSRMHGESDLSAAEYHTRCLEIIINTLGDEQDTHDENLLAAIVILRSYEEISESDLQTHLEGSTRLLNSYSTFASSGGLAGAACWITLRQEIYISLTSNQPININLEHYERSQALVRTDHDAWANRITLIFARILSVIFHSDPPPDWHTLKASVDAWYETKPASFTPIVLPADEEEKGALGVFPNAWMLDSAQVVGMQNYYMARIVLATFDPRLPGTGFHSFRARKETEDAILKDLRLIVGLAVHNDIVQSAILQASHILSICGFCLRDKREQEGAVEFLKNMERQTGWRTTHIIENLKKQWE